MDTETDEAPIRICRALMRGELTGEDLNARRLGAFLDRTSSVLYRRWGSLDGLLFAVGQAGFGALIEHTAATGSTDLGDLAAAFVDFGLDHPVLYGLMLERPYDWAALREAGAFGTTTGAGLWQSLVVLLEERGSPEASTDARVLFAGLHGLVSLAASGRANIGDLALSDRQTALAAARRLVHLTAKENK